MDIDIHVNIHLGYVVCCVFSTWSVFGSVLWESVVSITALLVGEAVGGGFSPSLWM